MAEKKNKKNSGKNEGFSVSVETLLENKKELRKLRFDNALGQLSDTSKIKKKRKEIARVLTEMNKKGGK